MRCDRAPMDFSRIAFDRAHLAQNHALVGVDEAGRGPLVGNVVASAVLLTQAFFQKCESLPEIALFNDSKKLSAKERQHLFETAHAWERSGLLKIGVGQGSVQEIERLNILGATRKAMAEAIAQLEPLPDSRIILIDGRPHKVFPYGHEGIVKGDGKSLAIAMASIVAKVTRDAQMQELDQQYPLYGFAQHKGYGTAAHRKALLKYGACPEHRKLFLRKILA